MSSIDAPSGWMNKPWSLTKATRPAKSVMMRWKSCGTRLPVAFVPRCVVVYWYTCHVLPPSIEKWAPASAAP